MTGDPTGLGRRAPHARQQAVLEAAEALFVRHGIDATSMSQIARHAGVAKGTVYLYFPSKEQLVRALELRFESAIVARTRAAVAADEADLREAGPAWCAALVGAYLDTQPVHDMLFLGRTAASREAAADNGLIDDLAGLLTEAHIADPAEAAAFLVGGTTTLVDRALLGGGPVGRARLADSVRALARRIMAG